MKTLSLPAPIGSRKRGAAFFSLGFLFLLSLVVGGCSLQMVAPYDAKTEEQIFTDARLVDQFYAELLDTAEDTRHYAAFAPKYREIESELRALVLRNKVRKLNEDSIEITQKLLKQWIRCKERHKEKDAYKDAVAELDRDRFSRMFEYAAGAEGAKVPAD